MSTIRAFEGPNGWYVASEDDDGFHWQPADGGHLSRAHAERLAREWRMAERERHWDRIAERKRAEDAANERSADAQAQAEFLAREARRHWIVAQKRAEAEENG